MALKEIIPHSVLKEMLNTVKETDDIDVLRESVQWLIQQLIEADVTEQIGAGPYERTETRTTQRNGSRQRTLKTRVGGIELKIPKLREGSYYPDWLLDRQRPAERALVGVVMEAYVNGVSTRKVDKLVKELGLEGIDKSSVSRINKGLDERVAEFSERPLESEYPYLWLDATFPKVREGGRVQSTALVIAMGVNREGYREILGFALGAAETEAFWLDFLRSLVERGLHGVRLVISDAHQGLTAAVDAVLTGASWQRCRTHFMRNVLTQVPKSAQSDVADMIRTIFEQPTLHHARAQLGRVTRALQDQFPRAVEMLKAAEDDILAHMHFPRSHWRRLRSTNSLERLNREIKRRFNVVGIFPDRQAVLRLGGSVLLEQHDEWISGRRYFSERSMKPLFEADENKRNLMSAG